MYRQAPETYIRAFRNGSCNRRIICLFYDILTKDGLILPLEQLEPGYKYELKQMALEYSGGSMDIPGVVAMAKLIHLIANNV